MRESARETRATHSDFSGSPEKGSRVEPWRLTDEDRKHGRREGLSDGEIDTQAAELVDQIADGRRKSGKDGRAQWRSWVRSYQRWKAMHPNPDQSDRAYDEKLKSWGIPRDESSPRMGAQKDIW